MNKLKFFTCISSILILGITSLTLMGQSSPEKKDNNQKWVPKLEGRVTDYADLFTNDQRRSMIEKLSDYEKETTHQIVVLTVLNLRGESIETFSLRVAKAWGIGHRGLNNGILVTLALRERKVRIELGLGMERFISNELSGKIINKMIPFFKKKNYAEGVNVGIQSLMEAARKYIIPKSKRTSLKKL
ncbi:MAG: TPM domain-containing protein [bacterium]|nr:TPM domain-containing protein [bacterium]